MTATLFELSTNGDGSAMASRQEEESYVGNIEAHQQKPAGIIHITDRNSEQTDTLNSKLQDQRQKM